MEVTITLSEEDLKLFEEYAKGKSMTLSEMFKATVMDAIEEEKYDIKCYEEAMEEIKRNPTTYTQEDLMEIFGIEQKTI